MKNFQSIKPGSSQQTFRDVVRFVESEPVSLHHSDPGKNSLSVLFNCFFKNYFIVCVWELCLDMSTPVYSAIGDQKGAPDPLGLELAVGLGVEPLEECS